MYTLLPRYVGLCCILTVLAGVAPVFAQNTPTPQTRPADSDRANPSMDPVQIVQHVREYVLGMDLSDYQKKQVLEAIDKADQQAKDLQDRMGNLSPRQKMQQVGELLKSLRQQLGDILNADQVRELQAKLNESRPDGRGGEASILNLRDAIGKLDLSTDQRQQVSAMLLDMAPDLQALRSKAQNGEDVREDLQKIREQMKEKLGKILTPDQQQQLRDMMEQAATGHQDEKPMVQGRDMASTAGKQTAAAASTGKIDAKIKELADAPGADIGSIAPDVKIQEADGHEVSLSSFKGHVVVIEFGALSCPSFRDHAEEMEKLKSDVGSRAFFVMVYTREPHPAGEDQVERNRQAKIDIPQPATLDARKDLAVRARTMLHISFPITVDDMDDTLARALGGFPNGCIVIGKNGQISAHQRWTDPSDLRRLIDEANK